MSHPAQLEGHHIPEDFSDRIALGITKFLRFFADTFFAGRYGHRAVVLKPLPPCRAWWAVHCNT